ncbi:MAG: ABC transporter ATP-binding protein [Gammaproteobacteria bacterium]|nr:MAG: ABC transporter ATP-binding protein [Gammaproteobacteria bacterium]
MAAVLELRHLTRKFGDFTAVNDISLSVEEGSFFSILGPSGCGKTTLLRMIAGFQTPSSGDILIRGQSVLNVPPNKRPVNLVFQHLALFPMMDVAENIAFGLKRRKVPAAERKRRIDSILERVGLAGYGAKRIDQLSGGQRQRVAIARALVLEPSILLLDEPLGALDLKLREHMKIELKKLQSQVGTTFIYITHDQSEALVMSDQVAVMNAGRFEQVDTPRALYDQPATRFVAGFVGESNRFTGQLEAGGQFLAEEGLSLRVAAPDTTSGDAELFIRPEAILLEPEPHLNALNRFRVQVRNVIFDGSNTRVLSDIKGTGHEIIIALPQNQRFAHIGPGSEVDAGVAAEDCRCFSSQD